MNKRSFLVIAAACVLAAGAQAQTFPDKPVKIIMPFPTGTGPDTVMRLVGERLSKMWGQQVIIENRPGANGWLAMEAAKRAAPDGYTLLQADAPPMTVAQYLWKKLPYDPVKDFEPIAACTAPTTSSPSRRIRSGTLWVTSSLQPRPAPAS